MQSTKESSQVRRVLDILDIPLVARHSFCAWKLIRFLKTNRRRSNQLHLTMEGNGHTEDPAFPGLVEDQFSILARKSDLPTTITRVFKCCLCIRPCLLDNLRLMHNMRETVFAIDNIP